MKNEIQFPFPPFHKILKDLGLDVRLIQLSPGLHQKSPFGLNEETPTSEIDILSEIMKMREHSCQEGAEEEQEEDLINHMTFLTEKNIALREDGKLICHIPHAGFEQDEVEISTSESGIYVNLTVLRDGEDHESLISRPEDQTWYIPLSPVKKYNISASSKRSVLTLTITPKEQKFKKVDIDFQ